MTINLATIAFKAVSTLPFDFLLLKRGDGIGGGGGGKWKLNQLPCNPTNSSGGDRNKVTFLTLLSRGQKQTSDLPNS